MNPLPSMPTEPSKDDAMPRMFGGWLIAVTVMASIYAIALIIAANMTPTAETANHAGIVEFANALKLVSMEHRTVRASCEGLVNKEKDRCRAAELTELRRAKARDTERYGISPAVKAPARDSKALPEIDVALYRAHRQLY